MLFYIFLTAGKSHGKTEPKNVSVCLAVLSNFEALPVALSPFVPIQNRSWEKKHQIYKLIYFLGYHHTLTFPSKAN